MAKDHEARPVDDVEQLLQLCQVQAQSVSVGKRHDGSCGIDAVRFHVLSILFGITFKPETSSTVYFFDNFC